MENAISLKSFLDEYGESMAEKVIKELSVIHDPVNDKETEISAYLGDMKKKPFPSQGEIIKACCKSLISGNKSVYTVCEMGTGKTLMAIACCYILYKLKKIQRVIVMCPPTLVLKWIQEIKDSLDNFKTYNLNGKGVILQLEKLINTPKTSNLEFYIIGKERAKTGFLWRPAVILRNQKYYCPKCGKELLDKDGYPISIYDKNTSGRFKKKYFCENKVMKWKYNPESGKHYQARAICGEQLWQPDISRKEYRKPMPAKFIKEKMKGCFDFLIADEVHQFKNQSGQGYAFGALAKTCKYSLCLTGTLAGGYSSDVFQLLFRTHPNLMLEDNNKWNNPKSFIEKYGVLEKITTVKEEDGLTTKAKRKTIVKEKPGISPLLLGKMLLSNSVFMRLSDCMEHLVPYEEDVIELEMPPDMAILYSDFEDTLKKALKEALAKWDNSLLGAYLHALLSYPERIYQGIEVIHPHTKDFIAYGPPLEGIMPKEHELVSIVKSELNQNRKVMIYIQNSNTTDISPRLIEMLEDENIKVKMLRSGDTENRAQIIDNWVKKGMEVLITNPKKVEVGMDLLDFPSIIFYQIPMSTYTLRQASRRSWRIPQKKPVRVYFLTYLKTMQTRLMQLMADKLMCSLAIEGELSDKGLAALSETSDSMAKELVKMLIEKSELKDNDSLKDVWAAYRKKEVQAGIKMDSEVSGIEPEAELIFKKEDDLPAPEIKKIISEADRIGDKIVKVQFTEYIGKRKKKVTHIEVTTAELDKMIETTNRHVQVQYSLF